MAIRDTMLGGRYTCPTRKRFEKMTLAGQSSLSSMKMAGFAKKVVIDLVFNKISPLDVADCLRKMVEAENVAYYLPSQKEEDINTVTSQIIQYVKYLKDLYCDYNLYPATEEEVDMFGTPVTCAPILWGRHKGRPEDVIVVGFSYSRNHFTDGGRTDDSSVHRNLRIYSLIRYGEKVVPSAERVTATVASLKATKSSQDSPRDTSEFVRDFTGMKTVFTHPASGVRSWEDKFHEAYLRFQTGKPCSKTNCQKCELYHLCTFVKPPVALKKEEAKKSKHSFSLSPAQEKVVGFSDGVLRVNAGAGAGKTTVVVLNIISKLISGEDPSKILLITFTNAGADEMRQRLYEYAEGYGMEKEEIDKVVVTTFNGLGQMVLDKLYKELGFSKKPTLISPVEAYDILLDLLKGRPEIAGFDYRNALMNLTNAKGVVPALYSIIEELRKDGVTHARKIPDELLPEEESREAVFAVYQDFSERMKRDNLIDYSDQDRAVFEAVKVKPMLFSEEFGFEHVIVDEFQDTNDSQLEILKLMYRGAYFRSLIVVGDDSQSIFAFRGTTPKNIIHFNENFDNVEDVFLTENYRSVPEIVDLANKVSEFPSERISKTLIAKRSSVSTKPVFYAYDNDGDELKAVATKIADLVKSGEKLSDICFIARERADLRKMQNLLTENEVCSRLDVSEPLDTSSRVLAAYDLAEYFRSKSLGCLLGYLDAVYDNALLDMDTTKTQVMLEKNAKFFEDNEPNITEEQKKGLFLNLLEVMNDGDELYARFLRDVKDKAKKFKVDELIDYILKVRNYQVCESVRREATYEAVTLCTVHSSKGREWKHCFVSLTKFDSTRHNVEWDEAFRLLFVALTRARDTLTITCGRYIGAKDAPARRYNYLCSRFEHGGLIS